MAPFPHTWLHTAREGESRDGSAAARGARTESMELQAGNAATGSEFRPPLCPCTGAGPGYVDAEHAASACTRGHRLVFIFLCACDPLLRDISTSCRGQVRTRADWLGERSCRVYMLVPAVEPSCWCKTRQVPKHSERRKGVEKPLLICPRDVTEPDSANQESEFIHMPKCPGCETRTVNADGI